MKIKFADNLNDKHDGTRSSFRNRARLEELWQGGTLTFRGKHIFPAPAREIDRAPFVLRSIVQRQSILSTHGNFKPAWPVTPAR